MSELMKLLRGGAKGATGDNAGQGQTKQLGGDKIRTKPQGGMMDQRNTSGDWEGMETEG